MKQILCVISSLLTNMDTDRFAVRHTLIDFCGVRAIKVSSAAEAGRHWATQTRPALAQLESSASTVEIDSFEHYDEPVGHRTSLSLSRIEQGFEIVDKKVLACMVKVGYMPLGRQMPETHGLFGCCQAKTRPENRARRRCSTTNLLHFFYPRRPPPFFPQPTLLTLLRILIC